MPRPSSGLALTPLAASPFAALTFPSTWRALEETTAMLKRNAAVWYLQRALPQAPADDVMLALVSPEAFWLLREWRRSAYGEQEAMRRVLDSTRQRIHAMGQEHAALRGATVSVRSKSLWSTFHKATVRNKQVHDVLAVRVVVKGDDDACFAALEAIRAIFPSDGTRFKDYVSSPKPNGYQGLHDTLVLPNGQAFEIQIRTHTMHSEAEVGTAAHRRYKQAPVMLSQRMLSSMAGAAAKPQSWPLRAETALALASKLATAEPAVSRHARTGLRSQ